MTTSEDRSSKAATGVAGLDDILAGGLSRRSLFLLEGQPGTGKTTIALKFLMAGAEAGERGLYITLSETERELRDGAASHGWRLDDKIDVYELLPPESLISTEQQQTLLYASDLELGEASIDRAKPQRLVLDSLSEIRLLAQSSLRYRRQLVTLKHFFARHDATILILDDLTAEAADKTAHSIAHGVIRLEELAPHYGSERRRARILKYRGQKFRGGYHDFLIRKGGVEMFPRLVAGEHRSSFERKRMKSDIEELDALLGGGIEQGSSALILGPADTGKTTFALHFALAALHRGEKATIFVFDEELGLLFDRMDVLGMELRQHQKKGNLVIEQIDAAELSPGEFAHKVRDSVNRIGAKTVVIDSLNGYQAAMPEENSLALHIHELLQYLNRQGATTFRTVAQHGLVGDMEAPVDVTYLADTVILLRYFEVEDEVRRAISVIKKRTGPHETTNPRIPHQQRRACGWRAADGISGRTAWRAGFRRLET